MGYIAIMPYRGHRRGKQADGDNEYDVQRILNTLRREGYTSAVIYRADGMGSKEEKVNLADSP